MKFVYCKHSQKRLFTLNVILSLDVRTNVHNYVHSENKAKRLYQSPYFRVVLSSINSLRLVTEVHSYNWEVVTNVGFRPKCNFRHNSMLKSVI